MIKTALTSLKLNVSKNNYRKVWNVFLNIYTITHYIQKSNIGSQNLAYKLRYGYVVCVVDRKS